MHALITHMYGSSMQHALHLLFFRTILRARTIPRHLNRPFLAPTVATSCNRSVNVYMYICVHIYVYTYICMSFDLYRYILYICMCVYIHIFIFIYIYIHICIYIYMYILAIHACTHMYCRIALHPHLWLWCARKGSG